MCIVCESYGIYEAYAQQPWYGYTIRLLRSLEHYPYYTGLLL